MSEEITQEEGNQENVQVPPLQKCKITEIIMMNSTFGKYVMYKILVGDVPIKKRYNDFYVYYQTLRQQWPGLYIPRLPQKQPLGNLDDQFIRMRRLLLQQFLDELMRRTHLWNSYENTTFLQQENATSTFKSFSPLNTEQILQKYQQIFPQFVGQEVSFEVKQYYSDFCAFINRIKPMIDNFRKMCQNFVDSKTKYRNEYQIFVNFVLPEYQKTLLFKDEKKYFDKIQKFDLAREKVAMKYNYDQILVDLTILEADVEAYSNTFNQIQKWSHKIQILEEQLRTYQLELQQTISSKRNQLEELFLGSRDKKIQKLQLQIQNSEKEISSLKQIVDILILLITKNEILHYKQEKEFNFFKLLKIMGMLEMEELHNMREYWTVILDSKEVQSVVLTSANLKDSIIFTSEDGSSKQQQQQHEPVVPYKEDQNEEQYQQFAVQEYDEDDNQQQGKQDQQEQQEQQEQYIQNQDNANYEQQEFQQE